MKKLFFDAILILKKNRIIFIINLFVVFWGLVLGYLLSVYMDASGQYTDYKMKIFDLLSNQSSIKTVTELMLSGNVLSSILYTFGFNFFSGAMISTTLTGIIFPLPVLVMLERGLLIGFISNGSFGGYWHLIVFILTLILEFGAYVLSATCGVMIGLSMFQPQNYKTKNRWIAFISSIKDSLKIYPFIAIILFVAACVEMLGLNVLIK